MGGNAIEIVFKVQSVKRETVSNINSGHLHSLLDTSKTLIFTKSTTLEAQLQ